MQNIHMWLKLKGGEQQRTVRAVADAQTNASGIEL